MIRRVVSIGEAMVELSGGQHGTYTLGFAGDTLNTAYYLRARLGDEWQVDYLTALGDDLYSTQMRDFIEHCGIGIDTVRTIEGKRAGLYMIHQADGDRHFTYWRDSSAAKQLADDPATLEAGIGGADLVYFSGITLAILAPGARQRLLDVIAARRAKGAMVAFDPNIRPQLWPDKAQMKDALMAAAAVSTLVMPTHSDEAPYFGDDDDDATADRYLSAGADEVVVKNGADPALIATGNSRDQVAAKPVETVVDTTGAGDSFNGGYIAARLEGASPTEAGKAGHETAAIVIAHHGALVERQFLKRR